MTQPDVYSVKQLAERLHLTPRAVQHRIQTGTIKATKLGDGRTSAYVITHEEVERLLRQGTAA